MDEAEQQQTGVTPSSAQQGQQKADLPASSPMSEDSGDDEEEGAGEIQKDQDGNLANLMQKGSLCCCLTMAQPCLYPFSPINLASGSATTDRTMCKVRRVVR